MCSWLLRCLALLRFIICVTWLAQTAQKSHPWNTGHGFELQLSNTQGDGWEEYSTVDWDGADNAPCACPDSTYQPFGTATSSELVQATLALTTCTYPTPCSLPCNPSVPPQHLHKCELPSSQGMQDVWGQEGTQTVGFWKSSKCPPYENSNLSFFRLCP